MSEAPARVMKSCRRSIAGLVVDAAVAGCGSDENAERAAPTETQPSHVLARAKLRDIGGQPSGQLPTGFNGAENTTVELVETAQAGSS